MEVAVAIALDIFDAFAFEPEHGGRLSARGDANAGLAVESRHLDFGAESSLNKIYRDFAKQVVSVALKNLVRPDMNHDIEIAGRAAPETGLAIAGGAEA